MGPHYSEQDIPLPRGWTKHAKSALIRAVSLAATALNLAYGQATTSKSARNRLDRATSQMALLTEELLIRSGTAPTRLAERAGPVC